MHRILLAPVLLSVLLAACGPQDDTSQRRARSFPFLRGLEGRIQAERGGEATWAREYLAGGVTLSEEVSERRLFAFLGKMMHDDPPEDLARFVVAARRHLYEEFFHQLSDGERLALAEALREHCADEAVMAEKYAAVLGARSGVFPATLELMVRSLPLADIAKPSPMSAIRIVTIARNSGEPEILVGAAEILANGTWVAVKDEPRDHRVAVEAARALVQDAVRLRPDDPAVRMSHALLGLRAEVTRAELERICRDGLRVEKDNAAYDYLIALTLSNAGRDDDAARVVRQGLGKPYATFHDVERARAVAAFLEQAGLGPVGSRLAAYNTALVDGPSDLVNLAQFLRESRETMRGPNALVSVFPRRLSAQMEDRPRLLSTELIRLILLEGTWSLPGSQGLDADEAERVHAERRALEAGMELASGPEAWDDLFTQLGEEGFLRYVDDVLYGGEPAFLKLCAEKESLAECAKLLN
jgi:hypothetical protein